MVFFVLAIWSICSISSAQEWCFQGSAKMQMYFPDRTQEQSTVYFKMSLSGCKWLVRFVRDEGTNSANAADYREASFDGTNVYYLCNLKSAIERQRKLGSNNLDAPNIAHGRAYQGSVFHLRMVDETSPIWLAYASGCYLADIQGDLVEPGMVFDGVGGKYGPPNHLKLKAQWLLSESTPRFPTRVVYLNDGYMYSPHGRLQCPVPYNNGFTNAIYQVERFTNISGLSVPCVSSLRIFQMSPNATTSTDLQLFVEYRMNLTNAMNTIDISSFQPAIPGITALQDERFGMLNYYATNRWPVIEELRSGEYFEKIRKLNIRAQTLGSLSARAGKLDSGRSLVVIRSILVLLALLPLVLFVVRRWLCAKNNPQQTTKNKINNTNI